jgi:Uma2 family endonuclease
LATIRDFSSKALKKNSMVQNFPQLVSFDDFNEWLPSSSEHRYELWDGVIVEMPKPRGEHSRIAGLITAELNFALRQAQQPWFVPKELIVRSIDSRSGYEPDVVILDQTLLGQEPRWDKESIITNGSTIPLIVEVVSGNWQDDYVVKQVAYEAMGIPEYWIVDYLGIGGRRFIGAPKQPTVSVYRLVEGEYDVQLFRAGETIQSFSLPALALTIDTLLDA